jgi:hypothetical protein
LASHPSDEVRDWVARLLVRVPPDDAVPMLKRLIRDRNPDVRDEALITLTTVDRSAASDLLPEIHRRLKSPDVSEPIRVMWALAAIGDLRSIGPLSTAATRWPPHYAAHRIANVVIALCQRRLKTDPFPTVEN